MEKDPAAQHSNHLMHHEKGEHTSWGRLRGKGPDSLPPDSGRSFPGFLYSAQLECLPQNSWENKNSNWQKSVK